MAAQVVKRLPEDDDWIYELKFDGYRALIIKDKQRVDLRSRKNKDLTGMYRGIAAAGLRLKAHQAVVDGEIVALDAQGSPPAIRLRSRHVRRANPGRGQRSDLPVERVMRHTQSEIDAAVTKRLVTPVFLRNCWYVAAWVHELIDGRILARTLLEDHLLLYRGESGQIASPR